MRATHDHNFQFTAGFPIDFVYETLEGKSHIYVITGCGDDRKTGPVVEHLDHMSAGALRWLELGRLVMSTSCSVPLVVQIFAE